MKITPPPVETLRKDDEDVLFFAFRYALGRRTGAVTLLVQQLKANWQKLRPHTQEQVQDEIRSAIENKNAGDTCDIQSWAEVLALPIQKDKL